MITVPLPFMFSCIGTSKIAGADDAWFVIWTTTPGHPSIYLSASGFMYASSDACTWQADLAKSCENVMKYWKLLNTKFWQNTRAATGRRFITSLVWAAISHCFRKPRHFRGGNSCVHTARPWPGRLWSDLSTVWKLRSIDHRGHFTEDVGIFAGLHYDEGIKWPRHWRSQGALSLSLLNFVSHCWRCKEPVLFRATEQWFASIEGFRQALIY